MKALKLWILSDTKDALSNGSRGVDASLGKWDSIAKLLDAVHSSSIEACGICYDHEPTKGLGCKGCPVQMIDLDCSLSSSMVHLFLFALGDAISRAGDIKTMLRKIQRDEEKVRLVKERREPVFMMMKGYKFY